MLTWPTKDPDEIWDYEVNWCKSLYNADELAQYEAAIAANPALEDAEPSTVVMPADTISVSTFTLPPGASLVALATSNTTRSAKIRLSGGDDGMTYRIDGKITMASGQVADRTFKLKVKSL